MADFALGLAKMAVEGTLSRVQSAIDEENKLKAAAQQDLVFITEEFQIMQSFLNVASKDRARNEVVRTWVRQLRNLAFDVEDCVEFVIHLDNESTRNWVWRLVPSCMAPPRTRDLDVAVAELKLLKARVEEVSQRNTRYNLISDSGSSNPVSQQSSAVHLATSGPSTMDILMELWKASRKHRGFCNLQKLITNEGNDLQVISLWASAVSDIEVVQIIDKAYCDPEICHIFNSRAWVKLMHPFKPDKFLKDLQTQLQASSRSCQAVDSKAKTSEEDPMKQLTQQRYLIILEGISSVVEWDVIRMYLPDNNNGSRIVVSTKQIGHAIFCTGEPYRVSVLREFTGGHYLCAFYKRSARQNFMDDLIWLLKRPPGVISVWGTGNDKSSLVKELFDVVRDENKEILNSQGAKCIFYEWGDVVHPFILDNFCQSLLQSFHDNETEYAAECHSLLVINGLQSTKEWQLINNKFATEGIKGHIIVITNDESVATSCVDHGNRALNVNDVALHPSIQIHCYMDELFWRLRHRRVTSVWGAGGDTTTLLKQVYDGIKHQHVGFKEVEKFEYYLWVDTPHPFDKDQFRMHLRKELFPDVEDEELEESIHTAREKKGLFILNGLQSTEEWELMKPYVKFFPKSRVILIANEESVAKRFVEHLEANEVYSHPLTKASEYYGYADCDNNKEAPPSMFLFNRMKQLARYERSQQDTRMKIQAMSSGHGVGSVWGMAGVGKSALVRTIYIEQQITKSSFERFAWVDVPAGPFDLVEFSRLLLLDFHRCDLEAMEAATIGIMQGQDPIQGCCEILRQGKYLVIIDDLRSTYDWDLIEAAFFYQPTTNARIVVITTEESIAKHSVKQQADQMFNLKCLGDNEACEILKELIDPNDMKRVSQMGNMDLGKLVAKCGGLPKVVSAIGKVPWSFLQHMNDDFMVKLENDPQFDSLSSLFSWMHSYFNACSDLVKPCIFYLSVLPASSKIRKGRLVRRWIAEGYCRDTLGCTARENAQKRFFELVELSIIQQATSQLIWHVNGFFHEYISSRTMEDNLGFALDGYCNPNTPRTGHHLTIMRNWHRDKIVLESIDLTRLRSLTVFGTWCSFFISDKMKRLRVLDLEDMISLRNDDIVEIFVKLLSLKFISLRGCSNISRLPDTLGGLRQLQTLDVRFTSIAMLPSTIIKLPKLQYIRAGTDQDWTSASSEDSDGVTSQLPAATSPELEGRDSSISPGQPTVQTSPENGIAESPAQAGTTPEAQDRPMLQKVGWASKLSRTSVVPRLPKFPPVTWSLCGSEREKEAQHLSAGVDIPVGIENIAALHTVGVVNVNASGGEAFLKQLAKLTQLLKLRVCGINKKNWQLLCTAISDHGHLESLSVRFDVDCLDDSFKPPKTLKSLKLYGLIMKLPDTIKDLVNLKKLDLEMTIRKPDVLYLFMRETLPCYCILNRFCINVQGDNTVDFSSEEFSYYSSAYSLTPRVLKIDCSSQLKVTFGSPIVGHVGVLIIQCSKGSFFRVTGQDGLEPLNRLDTVRLKGSYSEEQRVHLKELVDHHYRKVVLKLEPLQ